MHQPEKALPYVTVYIEEGTGVFHYHCDYLEWVQRGETGEPGVLTKRGAVTRGNAEFDRQPKEHNYNAITNPTILFTRGAGRLYGSNRQFTAYPGEPF